VPTGTPTPDLTRRLHQAAQRVLLRDGAAALTSRAVTTEAGLAKGILHRHFPDFDTFLATLVLAQLELLEDLADQLRAHAGDANVAENVAGALDTMLAPVTVELVVLVRSRLPLRRKLQLTTPAGTPLLAETTTHIAAYLTAERGLGRIAIQTDVDQLAVTLVGTAHLTRLDAATPTDLRALLAHLVVANSDPPNPQRSTTYHPETAALTPKKHSRRGRSTV
jgi:AcrR family transcriptional regulator